MEDFSSWKLVVGQSGFLAAAGFWLVETGLMGGLVMVTGIVSSIEQFFLVMDFCSSSWWTRGGDGPLSKAKWLLADDMGGTLFFWWSW